MINMYSQENVVYTLAQDKLDDKDYDKMLPYLKDKIKKYYKINWYFEMANFDGWTLSALWRDAKFDLKNKNHIDKVAMVGSKAWEKWMTKIMKPLTDTEIKFFELEEKDKAAKWIEGELII